MKNSTKEKIINKLTATEIQIIFGEKPQKCNDTQFTNLKNNLFNAIQLGKILIEDIIKKA